MYGLAPRGELRLRLFFPFCGFDVSGIMVVAEVVGCATKDTEHGGRPVFPGDACYGSHDGCQYQYEAVVFHEGGEVHCFFSAGGL